MMVMVVVLVGVMVVAVAEKATEMEVGATVDQGIKVVMMVAVMVVVNQTGQAERRPTHCARLYSDVCGLVWRSFGS
jgi:uncharacterized membrane protein YgdD (TMEM256/DUF423 family)